MPHPAPGSPPLTAEDAPCALLARTHGAQLAGTAPVTAGWVLLEQPGPWGRVELTSSGLEPALGAHLAEIAGDVRVQLVRRPGRGTEVRHPIPRTVVLAHVGPRPWAEQLQLDSDAELWDLDPMLAAGPHPPGIGTPLTDPLWLVCTHGKRDRCCAEHGRPIARALAEQHGDQVWEVSHVGGHRYAGNLLSLPGGEVYGLLEVADALAAVDLHDAGRYDVAHLRGRSGQTRDQQAAELLTRLRMQVDGRDAVTVEGAQPHADGAASVPLTVDGVDHVAVVRHVPTGVAYAPSCDADGLKDPGRYVLESLTRR